MPDLRAGRAGDAARRRRRPATVVSQDDPTFPSRVAVVDDRPRAVVSSTSSRADPDPLQGRPRGRAHRGLGAQEWRLAGDAARARACRRGSRAAGPKRRARGAGGADRAQGRARPESRKIARQLGHRSRPASSAAGPTACRWCRRPTSASCACWGAPNASPTRSSAHPADLAPCTVEKVAINAVMAGCKPEYMPVLLGVLEAALDPLFTLHGVLAPRISPARWSSSTGRSPRRSA